MSASNSGIELHGTHGAAEGEEIVSVAAPVGDAAAGPVNAGTLVSEAAAAAGAIAGLALTTGTINSALPDDALTAAIGKMKKKQAELRNQKKQLAKDLRNAERRKKRLRTRARQLTDEDLVQVLMLRKQQRADRSSVEVSSTASGSTSSSTAGDMGSASSSSTSVPSASDR